eukprot:361367-Chlamydomonas_euryale.AAC.7
MTAVPRWWSSWCGMACTYFLASTLCSIQLVRQQTVCQSASAFAKAAACRPECVRSCRIAWKNVILITIGHHAGGLHIVLCFRGTAQGVKYGLAQDYRCEANEPMTRQTEMSSLAEDAYTLGLSLPFEFGLEETPDA